MRYLATFIITMFLMVNICIAGPPKNEKYSHKGFPYHGVSFKDRPASEFNDTLIKGSCFYQEWVEGDKDVVKDIFPDGMIGVTFEKCNLDNIKAVPGNTYIKCSMRKIKVQNDWDDWILDDDLKPVEPISKAMRWDSGASINPKDIPAEKLKKEEQDAFKDFISYIIY